MISDHEPLRRFAQPAAAGLRPETRSNRNRSEKTADRFVPSENGSFARRRRIGVVVLIMVLATIVVAPRATAQPRPAQPTTWPTSPLPTANGDRRPERPTPLQAWPVGGSTNSGGANENQLFQPVRAADREPGARLPSSALPLRPRSEPWTPGGSSATNTANVGLGSPGVDSTLNGGNDSRVELSPTHGLSPDQSPGVPTGQVLLDQSASNLWLIPELSAAVRMRAEMLGQTVAGQGRYVQIDTALVRRVRLELSVGPDDAPVASLLQVCSGEDCWTKWTLPGRSRIERVRISKLRRAGYKPPSNAQSKSSPLPTSWLFDGGVARLVESIAVTHAFREPVSTDLQGLPVWMVEGIRRDLLDGSAVNAKAAADAVASAEAAQDDGGAGQGGSLSLSAAASKAKKKGTETTVPSDVLRDAFVPTHVRLYLRRGAQLALFPHRIEYLRAAKPEDAADVWRHGVPLAVSDPEKPVAETPQPLVTFDFYNVALRADVPDSYFQFDPAGERIHDRTEDVLNSAK